MRIAKVIFGIFVWIVCPATAFSPLSVQPREYANVGNGGVGCGATLTSNSHPFQRVPFGVQRKPSSPVTNSRQNANSHKDNRSTYTIINMVGELIGVFFGTSTGSTQTAAELIAAEFGSDIASEPIDIDTIKGSVANKFAEYDALIVGTPTWNTGADTERSGTGWDEIYYGEMQQINIAGKKVAVFGLGDQISYSENYADATGELHDVFEGLGCNMMGYTSQEGYEHEASKSVRGDKFCGLLLDAVNQEELTEERVKNWVAQLIEEGILEGQGSAVTALSTAASPSIETSNTAPPPIQVTSPSSSIDTNQIIAELEKENARLRKLLQENNSQPALTVTANDSSSRSREDYIPHYNPNIGRTMWTSQDGKSCYYTKDLSA